MKIRPSILNSAATIWAKVPYPLRRIYYRMNSGYSLGSFLLPNREQVVEICGGIAKGMKMRFNLNRDRLYYFGSYEESVQAVLTKLIRKDMTVFNIGANIGFHALALSRLVGTMGHVVAFEPSPKVRQKLIQNLSLNALDTRVCVEEYALSDFDGHAQFSLSLSDGQGRFEDLPFVQPGASIQVPCRRLDTYVSQKGFCPHFILMDVEYAEGRVLRGMSHVLENCKPFILIEMHSADSISESLIELERHKYFISTVPGLEIIKQPHSITRGHYLVAHSAHLNGPWPPIIER